jgi:predicted nucleotidyltransferase
MLRIDIEYEKLNSLCGKWKVREMGLFGSVLREDFGPESDLDVVVSFLPGAPWSLWDLVEMREELEQLFGRPVDLVEKEGLRNPYRRRSILRTQEVIYAS